MVVLVAATVSVVGGCKQQRSASGPASGATPKLACLQSGSTRPASGASAVTRTPRIGLVRNVQVQASACTDAVELLFWGGRPGWRVAYQPGPLRLDPSGRAVRLAGRAYLVVRLSPASGTDRTTGAVIYAGPIAFAPPSPSAITALHRLGDFEAVTSWAIGLPSRRPFRVEASADRLIVRVAAPSPRPSRCVLPGASLSLGYPSSWFAELTPPSACERFGPQPFAIVPNSDALTWTVAVGTTRRSPAEVVEATIRDGGVRRRSTHVAGYPATVLDVTVPKGAPFLPANYRYRLYVVAARPHTVLIQSVPVPPGPAVQRNRDAVERVAALTRRR